MTKKAPTRTNRKSAPKPAKKVATEATIDTTAMIEHEDGSVTVRLSAEVARAVRAGSALDEMAPRRWIDWMIMDGCRAIMEATEHEFETAADRIREGEKEDDAAA